MEEVEHECAAHQTPDEPSLTRHTAMNRCHQISHCRRICLPAPSPESLYVAALRLRGTCADCATGTLGDVPNRSAQGAPLPTMASYGALTIYRRGCKSSTPRPPPCTRASPMQWSPYRGLRASERCGEDFPASLWEQVRHMPFTLHHTRRPSTLWGVTREAAKSTTLLPQVRYFAHTRPWTEKLADHE